MQNPGNLTVTTPSDREIAMTRSFNAPRHLVFDACTTPELLKRWLYGPPDWKLEVCDLDVRHGGAIRMEWHGPDGEVMGLSGTYREVSPPDHLVHTELFDEDWTGGETLVTWDLDERDGVTTLTMTVLYSSQEARDGALQTPMAEGMEMGYNRLDVILGSLESDTGDREIVLTRLFDAPRELVFTAFILQDQIAQWWGPRGFTTTTHEMDVRPGGTWRFTMHGPDGVDYHNRIVYTEVTPPEHLAFLHGSDDDDDSNQFQTAVTFTQQNGQTLVTMRSIFASAEERDRVVREFGAIEGGNQTLDRLGEHLPTMQTPLAQSSGRGLFIQRIFDAPPEMVWRAWTEPELIKRWWGPAVFNCPVAEVDLRVGGKFLFCMQSDQGPDIWRTGIWSTGEYREIVPHRRIVCTDCFSDDKGNIVPATHYGMPDDIPLEMLVTVTFEDLGGKTRLTLRHTGLPSYMEQDAGRGWGESLDKLAEALAR